MQRPSWRILAPPPPPPDEGAPPAWNFQYHQMRSLSRPIAFYCIANVLVANRFLPVFLGLFRSLIEIVRGVLN